MSELDIATERCRIALSNPYAVERKVLYENNLNQHVKELWLKMAKTSTQKKQSVKR
jgi:hypothetical protein